MKKLVKHGNSLALVIEKPILKMLKISDKTDLEIVIENDSLVIRPVKAEKKSKTDTREIEKIAKRIMKKYDPVFRKLAKT